MKIQVEEDARARIERACERLVIEFALLNDLGDNDGVAALFAANGTYERPMAPGQAISGREAILASLKARDPRFSRHIVTNILVDVISNDRAKGRSYVTFMSTTNVSAPRPVTERWNHPVRTPSRS